MKNLIRLSIVIIMMAGFTTKTMAQVTLTGNQAGAELVTALTIANGTALHFGVIGITAGTAGSVLMTTDGVRTAGEATTTIINTGTQRTVAFFALTGKPLASYTITLPLTIDVTTATGTGDLTISIDALKISLDSGATEVASPATGTLTDLGASSFLLAGTLNFSDTQEVGVYAGTYEVTVDYL